MLRREQEGKTCLQTTRKKFYYEWDQRNGGGYDIKEEFLIRDIRASLYADENISFQEGEVDSAGERSDIYRGEAFRPRRGSSTSPSQCEIFLATSFTLVFCWTSAPCALKWQPNPGQGREVWEGCLPRHSILVPGSRLWQSASWVTSWLPRASYPTAGADISAPYFSKVKKLYVCTLSIIYYLIWVRHWIYWLIYHYHFTLYMGKPRHGNVKRPARSHTSDKQRSWDLNPGKLKSWEPTSLTSLHSVSSLWLLSQKA